MLWPEIKCGRLCSYSQEMKHFLPPIADSLAPLDYVDFLKKLFLVMFIILALITNCYYLSLFKKVPCYVVVLFGYFFKSV